MRWKIPEWLRVEIKDPLKSRRTLSPLKRRISIGIKLLLLVGLFGFAIWRINLGLNVSKQLRAITAAGLPISNQDLNTWYRAVPEDENAALALTRAFTLMDVYPDVRSNDVAHFSLPARGQSLTARDADLLLGHVKMNEAALAEAQKAFSLPKSRYPIDLTLGAFTPMPHLQNLNALAHVAEYEALLAVESRDTEQICLAIDTILGLAHTLDDEPVLISQLVRMRLLDSASRTLERVLSQIGLNERRLSELTLAFAAAERTNLVARAFIGERALNVPCFRMSAAEASRINRNQADGEPHPLEAPLPGKQSWLMRITGFGERDLCYYLNVMETNIALAASPFPQSLATRSIFEIAASEAFDHYYFLSGVLLPAMSRAVQREAESLAHLRLARTTLAIEQFRVTRGSLPADLTDLVPQFLASLPADPFIGAPFHYHRLAKGYVIYSVDSDGHDDGGREKPEHKKSTDKSSYDITFIVER